MPEQQIVDPTRMNRRRWTIMAGSWSILLLLPLVGAVTSDAPVAVRVLIALAVLAYIACYVVGLFEAMVRRSPPFSAALLAVMAGLFTVFAAHGTGVVALSFLVVAVIVLVPPPWGTLGAVVTGAVAVAVMAWLTGRWDVGDVVSAVVVVLAQLAMFSVIRSNAELRAAREELARLAVAGERERLARDLHDVLGHSLTTITVKAGLARRLLEKGDQARAADEVADVERLGRQALAEVRATVSANRVASLAAEIAGAAAALRAAGIEADLPVAVDDVPPERQQAFAYVVREGVTNAIRHSGASRLSVRLTPASVEVVDDGVGSPAATPHGNGLTGLTERLAAIGGWVEAGPGEQGGWRLRAACLTAGKVRA